jgi:tetratricopeptide (TPR) repeat protein
MPVNYSVDNRPAIRLSYLVETLMRLNMEYDERGLDVTADSAAAVRALDAAVTGYLNISRDTMALLDTALDIDPDLLMGHCLKGYMQALTNKPEWNDRIAASLAAARASLKERGATARETQHVEALSALYAGNLLQATAIWEGVLVDHPLDAIALKITHLHYFRLGDMPNLRDTSARVTHAWDETVPGYGNFLGIRSFGLMETGDYRAAEDAGTRAVDLAPRDLYAIHAVTHIHEMEGRWRDGLVWLDDPARDWDFWSNFRFHVWWHYGLFLIELEQYDEALSNYDVRVRSEKTDFPTDTASAISTLWRLEAVGVDVGARWHELGDIAEKRLSDHLFAYFDGHTMVALAADGRDRAARRMLASLDRVKVDDGVTQSRIIAEIGVPLCEAIHAYYVEDYGATVDLLMPIRGQIYRIGGSHVQRDIFVQTLMHAALKSGRHAVARALLAERVALKPNSGANWKLYARALENSGDATAASTARNRAVTALAV